MSRPIGAHMVKSPYTCESATKLREALEFMKECDIRHLPVIDGGRLSGLLSERDLHEALGLPQAEMLRVGDVMKTDVYVANRSTPLKDVVRNMHDRKFGSTVIVNDRGEVLGIFTVIDALRVLLDMLEDEEGYALVVDDYIEKWERRWYD